MCIRDRPGRVGYIPGKDMITIHEDGDGDGVFEHSKPFLEGLNMVTSFAWDADGVWVLQPPYLLFYYDKDKKLFYDFKGRKGALVAIEPKTGLIRALISSPTYDPNLLNTINDYDEVRNLFSDQNSPLFNRALSGQYPPASTLKPFVGMAALEAKTISWEKEILDSGEYLVEGDERPYRGWKEGGHGKVDMNKAIIESSDVYFYSLAYDLTVSNLSPFLEKFGFGEQSGLTTREGTGILPSRKWKLGYKGESWFKGDTINMGIGQGYITATPLQIAVAYSALANKG